MFWFKSVFILCVLVPHHWSQNVRELQFIAKFDGPHKNDFFGYSIASSSGKLVIGAPGDNDFKGVVYLSHGAKLEAPDAGDEAKEFGCMVDMNDEYLVVIGRHHPSIYIYQSNEPHELKARIPVYGDIRNVVIGDGNTIVATRYSTRTRHCYLEFYRYDGFGTWSFEKMDDLGKYMGGSEFALVISQDKVAVAFPNNDEEYRVDLYHNIRGTWSKTQTILFPKKDIYSLSMDGDHLAVSAEGGNVQSAFIFTYQFDRTTGKWLSTGLFHPPGDMSFVVLKGNVLVATVNEGPEPGRYKEVVGVVYKLSAQHRNIWEKVALLKTNGLPRPLGSGNIGLSIMNDLIFTGRVLLRGRSTVFAHNISQINSE